METDLQAVRATVDAADLSADARQLATQCLGQLPRLYEGLCQTYESRYSDEIGRLLQVLFRGVSGAPGAAEAIAGQLQAMHERLGIPGPSCKLPAPTRAARSRKGA
jgi:hypothetical protein